MGFDDDLVEFSEDVVVFSETFLLPGGEFDGLDNLMWLY